MKTSILLIEDDDISRLYLSEAITLLDIELTACPDLTSGCMAMRTKPPSLIISDLNLPDGGLLDMLAAFPAGIPILAISAEVTPAIRARLAAGGIRDVLAKPMPGHTVARVGFRYVTSKKKVACWWDSGKRIRVSWPSCGSATPWCLPCPL